MPYCRAIGASRGASAIMIGTASINMPRTSSTPTTISMKTVGVTASDTRRSARLCVTRLKVRIHETIAPAPSSMPATELMIAL